MKHAPFEGTKVRVTNPTFVEIFKSNNEWVVIGQGRMTKDNRFLYNCKPVNGTTIYQFFKEELEEIK